MSSAPSTIQHLIILPFWAGCEREKIPLVCSHYGWWASTIGPGEQCLDFWPFLLSLCIIVLFYSMISLEAWFTKIYCSCCSLTELVGVCLFMDLHYFIYSCFPLTLASLFHLWWLICWFMALKSLFVWPCDSCFFYSDLSALILVDVLTSVVRFDILKCQTGVWILMVKLKSPTSLESLL